MCTLTAIYPPEMIGVLDLTIFEFSFLELNNRKILEDLQHKKQLILQKGVSAVTSIPVNSANQLNSSMPLVEYFFLISFKLKSIQINFLFFS